MLAKTHRIFVLSLIAFTAYATASGQNGKPSPGKVRTVHSRSIQVNTDSSTNPPQRIITVRGDHAFDMRMSGDKIIEMYVDHRLIPADSFYLYDDMVKKINEQIAKDKAQAEEDRKQALKDELQAKRDAEQAARDAEQAKKDAEEAEKEKVQSAIDQARARKDQEQAVIDARHATEDRERALEDTRQAMRDKEQAMKDQQQAMKDREQAKKDRAQAMRDREQALIDAKKAEEDKAILKSVIAELVKQGVVPDEKSIHYLLLDETGLYVNGKQQSDELFRKIRASLPKDANISYHNSSRSN